MIPILYVVLPCYNEEEVLNCSADKMLDKLKRLKNDGKIAHESKLLFVNDGSKDSTWDIITELHNAYSEVAGLNLSRNRGHQNAVLAGLMAAKDKADVVISIDADLQQDIEAIDEMLVKYSQGCDIVYGVRNNRKSDGLIKKATALAFYGLMNAMGCSVLKNHADYRLMSKRAIEALEGYEEVNLFLRGLMPELGFKTDIVYFDVKPREAGESKYTMKKMINFAIDGITSFSIKPLQMVMVLGFIILMISVVMIILSIVDWINGVAVAGWPTVVCSIWFLGSVQLIAIGVLGEYVGKIYMETKKRPRYIVESFLWKE